MKLAVIMRGVPGAGKSTFLAETYPDAIVCSADHFFIRASGEYVWDPRLLSRAHEACMRKFELAVDAGAEVVAVDNTNVKTAHWQPYYDYARSRGYAVSIVSLDHPEPDVAEARNVHGVTAAVIERMIRDWED